MANYNRVIMIGNLTRDPEYKQLASGQAVCRLGLASNRQYKNKQTGSMVQEVCFIDIDVFGPQAESCRQYLQKGRSVLIEGRLKFDTWETQEGQTRSKHSIVADRVVFLASAAQQESDTLQSSDSSTADLEKELLGHIQGAQRVQEEPKSSTNTRTPKKAPQTSPGEMAFNDEPPFQDDLPF